MNSKEFLIHFAIVAITFFIVSAVVTSLWTAIRYGRGFVNWDTVFIFSIVLGIVFPLVDFCKKKIKY